MNLSMKWLKDFVNIDVSPREFSEAMTMSGSKVECFEVEGSDISNVVVGKVVEIEKHPDADKLVVCQIDIGKDENIQIVTGASNLYPGALVPVALDGSTLPNGIKIKKGKLRGVVSNGMMCSLDELNLTTNDFPHQKEDGIFILNFDAPLGSDICEVLGLNDVSVEFEITSNRPDCLSVIGLAREASATFDVPLTLHEPVVKGSGDDINKYISVDVQNTELCKRYAAKVIKNVKIEPSPLWIRERLRASGVRPINNLVDITNYVMLEYGQPLHAFDLDYLQDNKIIVRNARENETIITLDGEERQLSPEMLMICDGKKPVAVAGVMGGENSGILDTTKTVVFESAYFEPTSVRLTSKKLGLRTDASARFEKGIDGSNCIKALMRACELVEMLGAGEVVDGIIDNNNYDCKPNSIKFDSQWINQFLGINLSKEEMTKILESLDFKVENDTITAPSFRIDIEHKADIAEEIARIYGYNKIPTTAIKGVAGAKLTNEQKFERVVSDTLLSCGCFEAMTYSFISPKYYDNICLPKDSILRKSVTISNPLGEDTSVMRTTTLPSMLLVLSKNYKARNLSAKFFELGNEYIPNGENELPDENPQITVGMYGNGTDFYTIKGCVQKLLQAANVKDAEFVPYEKHPTFHPGRCAEIYKGDIKLGIIGEVHPQVAENYDIGTRVYLAKIDFKLLMQLSESDIQYSPLPKFPATTRDLSLLCDDDILAGDIEKSIKSAVPGILESIKLFDIYKGEQVEKGKKSVSYSIVLRAKDRTLTDEEADSAVKKILKNLKNINVELRF